MEPSAYLPSSPPSAAESKTSGLAIASLVLGILGFLTLCLGIGIVLALAGLIVGVVGLASIGKPGKPSRGKGLAIAGLTTSGIGLLLSLIALPMMIGIMLPAFTAARTTAQQLQSITQIQGIHQAVLLESLNTPRNANGERPQPHDLGELFGGGYFTVDYTQSPMDQVGMPVPVDFGSLAPDEQADWIRAHADFVLVPGLTDQSGVHEIAVFGKPDRFTGGIPVAFNDGSTSWENDTLAIDQQLQAQTGKTMAGLIAEAEAMAGP